jgi:hypothetical protein
MPLVAMVLVMQGIRSGTEKENTMRIPIMTDSTVVLLAIHALSSQHEGGDGSFHERHHTLLHLCGAVLSSPQRRGLHLTLKRKRSQTALACGVWYGVRSTLMPRVAATRVKFCPNLRSVSRISYVGDCPYGVASRSGTRHPEIGRRSRHMYVDDLP